MTLTNSNQSLISQALAMAASHYAELSVKAENLPGGDKLAQQFKMQAIQTRKVAILMDEADNVTIDGVGDEASALRAARRITSQEITDVKHQRETLLASQKAV